MWRGRGDVGKEGGRRKGGRDVGEREGGVIERRRKKSRSQSNILSGREQLHTKNNIYELCNDK